MARIEDFEKELENMSVEEREEFDHKCVVYQTVIDFLKEEDLFDELSIMQLAASLIADECLGSDNAPLVAEKLLKYQSVLKTTINKLFEGYMDNLKEKIKKEEI